MNSYYAVFAADGILDDMGITDGNGSVVPKFKMPRLKRGQKIYFIEAENEDIAFQEFSKKWSEDFFGKSKMKVKVI